MSPTLNADVNVNVDVDFEVYCSECGRGICDHVTEANGITIRIIPCEKCIKSAEENGFSDGYDEGYREGYARGVADELDKREG